MDPAARHAPGLHRELGVVQVTASGVGIIIGAGIYVLLGAATERAGAGVWVSFAVAGALSALTALSYCELAAMFPAAGAEYDYARHVAPRWIAFLVGWVMIAGLVVATAAVALGFAHYLRHFVDVPLELGALGLLAVVTLVALSGIRQSARLILLLASVQIAGLVLVIAIGVGHLGEHSLTAGSSTGGVIGGAALVFFAFIGFDEVITLSEETRDPVRTVPRGLLIALLISTLLYMAVAVAAVSVLGAGALARTDQPLTAVMRVGLGGASGDIVAAIAMVATLNAAMLCLIAASRVQFGMSRRSALPQSLGRLNARGVPFAAVITGATVAALAVLLGDLTLVASVTDFAVYLVFIAVNVVVIVLRYRQPHRLRPFRVPLDVGRTPVPSVVALLVVLTLLPGLDPAALLLGAGLVTLGVVVHLALARWSPVPSPSMPWLGQDEDVHRKDVTIDEAEAVMAALGIDAASVAWDVEQFRMGLESELGHGRVDPDTNVTDDDLVVTGRIALAHLVEIPDYYTRLSEMERTAFDEQARRRRRSEPPT
jgi:APA family basic amino acid/polyamine antiporter